ncbi:hypothetical protein KIPB_016211, partial [Kipferlia bialata]|eukprot:g16211.t1
MAQNIGAMKAQNKAERRKVAANRKQILVLDSELR